MNKQSITKYAVAIVLGLGVVFGVSSLQAAWTTPAGSPPGNNVDAPINVGTNSQSKLGQLFVNTDANTPFTTGFQVFGKSIFNGTVQIVATGATGKVLTSDATGNASWQTPAPGGSTATHGMAVYSTAGSYTWTVPAGVTSIKVTAIGGGGGGWGGGTCANSTCGYGGGGGLTQGYTTVTGGQNISISVGQGAAEIGFGPITIGGNTTVTAGGQVFTAGGGATGTNSGETTYGATSSGGTININGATGAARSLSPESPFGYSAGSASWGAGGNNSGTQNSGHSGAVVIEY